MILSWNQTILILTKNIEEKYKEYIISKYDEHCHILDDTGTRESFIVLLNDGAKFGHPDIESVFNKAHVVVSCYIKDENTLLLNYSDFKIKQREEKIDNIIKD